MALKVLLVDDSAVMRMMVGKSLKQAGFEVGETLQAGNGVEALDIVKNDKEIDLIMTDWNMPEMNGLEFVKEVRKIFIHQDTPIVMCTTEANMDKIKEAKDAGANGYLTKPFTPDKVKEKVGGVLKSS